MKNNVTEMKDAYLAVFGTARGQLVIRDLERIINGTRVTADAPNPYSAIYKVAQQALIQRINNMMEKETPKTKLGGK